jgi:hypothetical protein
MEIRGMKKGCWILGGVLCCVGVGIIAMCSPTSPSTPTKLDDLIVTNQIQGWSVDSTVADTVTHVTDDNINLFVDGGKIDYCGECNGSGPMKSGIVTFLKTAVGYGVEVFVLDYGTTADATAEFNVWAGKYSAASLETISPFANTTAIGHASNGAITAFAHFGKFYLELRFSNYNGETAIAVADASTFLSYYNSKIK